MGPNSHNTTRSFQGVCDSQNIGPLWPLYWLKAAAETCEMRHAHSEIN